MKRINILDKEDVSFDRKYWGKKTPEERLSAVEFLREQYYIIQGFTLTPRITKEVFIKENSE